MLQESYDLIGIDSDTKSTESIVTYQVFNPKWVKALDRSAKKRVSFLKWFSKEEPYLHGVKLVKVFQVGRKRQSVYRIECLMSTELLTGVS
jgi:replication initiation and membrane attachment protein DnaB